MLELKTDSRQLMRQIVEILMNMLHAGSGVDVLATAQGQEQS